MKRAALVVRGAAAVEPGMSFAGEAGAQLPHEARLANPGLPLDDDELALPLTGTRPGIQEQRELPLPADEREAGDAVRVHAVGEASRTDQPVGPDRLGDALQGVEA